MRPNSGQEWPLETPYEVHGGQRAEGGNRGSENALTAKPGRQHICAFSWVFNCSESCSAAAHSYDMCHNHLWLGTEKVPRTWMICPHAISFRDPFTCYAIAHPTITAPSRTRPPIWGLTMEIRLMLYGDFPFQFPASYLSCDLKAPHLQIAHFMGWGHGRA